MFDVIDMCCGGRSFWFDRDNPRTIFGDCRTEQIIVTDRSHGKENGMRTVNISPDILWDYRALPFADESFHLVVFDPPHFLRAGDTSYMKAKYGVLTANWEEDLTRGFSEAFRVLRPNGVLNFKWNDSHVALSKILPLVGKKRIPLFGQKLKKTHWLAFIK